MTKILTSTDGEALWAESKQNGKVSCQLKDFETIYQGKILDICNSYKYWTELHDFN